MPALNIDIDALEDKGFVKVLSGNDYLTVAGRLYLAHSSGQLLSVDTEEMYPDDSEYITIKATVSIYNPLVMAKIEDIMASEKIKHDAVKESIVQHLLYNALITEYTGMAQSKRKGGKSAEGTNPREVAETSSVGRALGNAGFGDTESFASFEEMLVAISRNDAEPEPKPVAKTTKKPAAKKADPNAPTVEQKEELYNLAVERLGVTDKADFAIKIEAKFMDAEGKGKSLADFTKADVDHLITELKKIAPF